MQQLSVVIITFNEERNIRRCLESILDVADDIVVLDSFSKDNTEKICKEFSVNFISRAWEGYSASKNFANDQAKYDWVLSLDADEALNEKLKTKLIELKKSDALQTTSFNRLTNYCGSWIKHGGWYPDVKVRLFNKNTTKWEGLIHEELKYPVDEKILHINEDILHYSYYTLVDHLKQIDKFTDLASKDLFDKDKKPAAFKLILNPIAKFIGYYFINLGFLDGAAGFKIAKYSSYATYLKYKKTRCLFKHAN